MSLFNLNERSMMSGTGNSVVFNNGIAGKVEDVKIDVQKRRADEPDTYPMYKLVMTDKNGAQMNQGFYEFTENPMKDAEGNAKMSDYTIDRVLSIAQAVVPEGFIYPDIEKTGNLVKDTNVVLDILFKIIKDNSNNTNVNVFATYGTKQKPDRFLKLRYFNFIEKAGNEGYSKLSVKGDDQMERLTEDAPKTDNGSQSTAGAAW